MKFKILMMLGFTVAVLVGCTTGEKFHNVQAGMKKQQIVNLLGNHDANAISKSSTAID